MDTVTESRLAIAMARQGGLGFVHRSIANRSAGGRSRPREALGERDDRRSGDDFTRSFRPRCDGNHDEVPRLRLAGDAGAAPGGHPDQSRPALFEKNLDQAVSNVMTKDNLVTVPVGTTLEEAERILQTHRIEKLLVVDAEFRLKGLITVKDIQKKLEFPSAAKGLSGRLLVGAAIGATGDFLERAVDLEQAKVDVLAIDYSAWTFSARYGCDPHGEAPPARDAVDRGQRGDLRGRTRLDRAGLDGIKVGIGPGSICTTRVVTGAGVPQITAILEAARAAKERECR